MAWILYILSYLFISSSFGLNFGFSNEEEEAENSEDDEKNNMENEERRKNFFHIPLDSEGKLEMFWDVYYDTDTVVMEIHARLQPTDWIAVGFSDYGEISDADFCVLWVDRHGKNHFTDTWSDSDGDLHVDVHQNCHLAEVRRDEGLTVFVWRRKFDTCEDDDYVIEEGTTHVVFGFGGGPLPFVDGLKLTRATKTGFQRTQLLKNENPVPPLTKDVRTLEIVNDRVHVPGVETTYWCSLHKLPPLPHKHHIVQYEAVIQRGNEALVHHMEVFHCQLPVDKHLDNYNAPCQAATKPKNLDVCKKVLAAWAMGALPLTYPEEAGSPIGGPGFSSYVMLEIHYNNPDLKSDWIDSSGMRFHFTSHIRRHEVGVIELGLEYTPKMAMPPKQTGFTLSGHCITECTQVGIPPSGIVIFASQLHTHLTGKKVVTRHVRGGMEMSLLNGDEHYSQHFQEIRVLKNPVLVLPGDGLITTCTYQTTDRENITLGGFAISDEMCVNYVHYYPKIDLEVCKSSIDTDVLNNYFEFMNEYESQDTSQEADVPTNYRAIKWTPLRSQLLHDLYSTAPLSMQCNQSDGNRFPGYWNQMPQVEIVQPLVKPPRNCPTKK